MIHKEKLEQLFAPSKFAHKAKVRANDKYVRDTLDVTNTAAEDAHLHRALQHVSPSVEHLYRNYRAFRRMKWLVETHIRTGAHHQQELQEVNDIIMSSIKTPPLHTSGDTKRLAALQALATQLMRASRSLPEEKKAFQEHGLDVFYIFPADRHDSKTVLDTTIVGIGNNDLFSIDPHKVSFVLTPHWEREWVLAGHIEYEYTPPGSSQPIRERISKDSYFKFSTNVPEIYPGQQLRLALDYGFGGNMDGGSVSKVSNLFDALDKQFFRVAYSAADITTV
jgi:hypothetical protein